MTTRDHDLQMSRERPEAICPPSETGRHQFFVTIDYAGRIANVPPSGVVICVACKRFVTAENGRWVLVSEVTPKYVIREELCIEDVIS